MACADLGESQFLLDLYFAHIATEIGEFNAGLALTANSNSLVDQGSVSSERSDRVLLFRSLTVDAQTSAKQERKAFKSPQTTGLGHKQGGRRVAAHEEHCVESLAERKGGSEGRPVF